MGYCLLIICVLNYRIQGVCSNMRIYFFDEQGIYIGSRELLEGEQIPPNATTNEVDPVEVDNSLPLELIRKLKEQELDDACDVARTGGIKSNVVISSTGLCHTYNTATEDRENLHVKYNILKGKTDEQAPFQDWKTMDHGIVRHTRSEFLSMYEDLVQQAEDMTFRCILMKYELDSLQTEEEILAVKW